LDLVTGATGILGSHVALALLEKGRRVVATMRAGSDKTPVEALFRHYGKQELLDRLEWREMDVTDYFSVEDALSGAARVYHCAGFVSFHAKDRKTLFRINELGTKHVVNASLLHGVKALCFVSSLATLRNPDVEGEFTEDVFWKTDGSESDYAVSKYNAEREAWRGIEEGLNTVIVNPGILLAPGFWDRSSSMIFTRAYRGNRFYTEGNSGYIGARDCARIMIELIERQQFFGERFILVEGNYSYKDILSRIQTCFGLPAPSIKANAFMLKTGYYALSLLSFMRGKEPEISKAMIRSLQNRSRYSNRKLIDAIDPSLEKAPRLISTICDEYLRKARKH
jgi:dihydroflavonol-4-reductase